MNRQALIAGGGIGGLAMALAASRAHWKVELFERACAFSEVGAGIQLGPNVVKVLHQWGLADALRHVAAFPELLQVRDAVKGRLLGTLRLGGVMAARYGAPYATVHRADLHGLLLDAVQQHTGVQLHLAQPIERFHQTPHAVTIHTTEGLRLQGDVLIGADGLWSALRQQLLGDGPPRRTGHLAYRALVPQSSLPAHLRGQNVTVWLGARMHIVHYPVRGGAWLNVVAIVNGNVTTGTPSRTDAWDHSANAADLAAILAGSHSDLQDLVSAITRWRLWPLCDRPPMQGAYQHAQGRVALLGDAAHPMRPYLAQGAGMALEDAAELGHLLGQATGSALDVPVLLQHYAQNRWQRCARVQARAQRNGQIFHAQGLVRWGRDASMKLFGEKLMDMPWLYGYEQTL
ncbi:MAG: FAD-dependent oxidoreductase [Polaromonas sp.]|nr:MAG: FAD-dependent oxidoreductase [Polaromonas sp.]